MHPKRAGRYLFWDCRQKEISKNGTTNENENQRKNEPDLWDR